MESAHTDDRVGGARQQLNLLFESRERGIGGSEDAVRHRKNQYTKECNPHFTSVLYYYFGACGAGDLVACRIGPHRARRSIVALLIITGRTGRSFFTGTSEIRSATSCPDTTCPNNV